MKNRERLLETNIYDLLINAQEILDKHDLCVLSLFGLPDYVDRCSGLCELCIKRWLDEDVKTI